MFVICQAHFSRPHLHHTALHLFIYQFMLQIIPIRGFSQLFRITFIGCTTIYLTCSLWWTFSLFPRRWQLNLKCTLAYSLQPPYGVELSLVSFYKWGQWGTEKLTWWHISKWWSWFEPRKFDSKVSTFSAMLYHLAWIRSHRVYFVWLS